MKTFNRLTLRITERVGKPFAAAKLQPDAIVVDLVSF